MKGLINAVSLSIPGYAGIDDCMEEHIWSVRKAQWDADGSGLLEVRGRVFIEEQGVDVLVERDGMDSQCLHAIAEDAEGIPIGAGRIAGNGKVGRIAVIEGWRGCGVGTAIMHELHRQAERMGMRHTYLHSQSLAAGFYLRFGYLVEGDEFLEAGIPHLKMVRIIHGD
jgi:predicted GNAT family N-acyltransferase